MFQSFFDTLVSFLLTPEMLHMMTEPKKRIITKPAETSVVMLTVLYTHVKLSYVMASQAQKAWTVQKTIWATQQGESRYNECMFWRELRGCTGKSRTHKRLMGSAEKIGTDVPTEIKLAWSKRWCNITLILRHVAKMQNCTSAALRPLTKCEVCLAAF